MTTILKYINDNAPPHIVKSQNDDIDKMSINDLSILVMIDESILTSRYEEVRLKLDNPYLLDNTILRYKTTTN